MGKIFLKLISEHGSPFYAWQNPLASWECRSGTVEWNCTVSLESGLTDSVSWGSPFSVAASFSSGNCTWLYWTRGEGCAGRCTAALFTVAKRWQRDTWASAYAGEAVGVKYGGTSHGEEPRHPSVLMDHREHVRPWNEKNEHKCRAQRFRHKKDLCTRDVRWSIWKEFIGGSCLKRMTGSLVAGMFFYSVCVVFCFCFVLFFTFPYKN